MTEEQVELKRRLESNVSAAWKKVQGSTGKSAAGAESAYGIAYQALVRAGFAPQIRKKYRPGI
jgi:hypothetical protein